MTAFECIQFEIGHGCLSPKCHIQSRPCTSEHNRQNHCSCSLPSSRKHECHVVCQLSDPVRKSARFHFAVFRLWLKTGMSHVTKRMVSSLQCERNTHLRVIGLVGDGHSMARLTTDEVICLASENRMRSRTHWSKHIRHA
jgi:hypothetical protein